MTKDAATGVATGFAVGDSGVVRKVVIAPPPPTVTTMSPTSGPTAGGTAVRIVGTNFTPAATVSFGSVAATPSAVSPTELTVATPPHAVGSVSVSVTTAGGTASVPGAFTYFAPASTTGEGGGGRGGGGDGGQRGGNSEVPVACPSLPQPSAGQAVLAGGYSLVGMPAGTVVASAAPLYGWLNQGAGGRYTVDDANRALEAGRGYWAFSTCPRLVSLASAGSSSASSSLGAYRASMVGNPSGTGPAAVSGHDFAARWDPNLNSGAGGYRLSDYRQPRVLGVGEGIWVFTYQDTTIQIAG
ncbi:MAG TPA: IPT/TIG domain-containing protein [Acidimicrobiales bacterium]|nr:IPT/TIG domain-containing protein [Acidimicrobiales bacterium]